jgi:hypothetical protein
MFDLEQSIAAWRQQMLAGALPILDELESHLREEMERKGKLGQNTENAFHAAVRQIGEPPALRIEFANRPQFLFAFKGMRQTTANQILGVFWFAQCAWFMMTIASSPATGVMILYFPHHWSWSEVFFTSLGAAGVCGSILLFCGMKSGQYVIRSLALFGFLLSVLECVTDDGSFSIPRYWFGILAILDLITIWSLHPPRSMTSTTKSYV